MKKNVMMRVASVLLICVLLTSSVISGTFAKYVTAADSADTARVAKWGVEINAEGAAFGKAYVSADGKISATYNATNDSVWNYGSDEMNLVAPGTGDNVATMTLSGQPEVDVNVTYTAVITLTGWMCDHDNDDATPEIEYCPIVFTVENETYGTTYMKDSGVDIDHDYATVDLLVEALQKAINDCSAEYEAGTNLSTIGEDAPSISWKWEFYTGADNDVRDTSLGDKAAAGNAATITIALTTTVTQID